jgi:hypothetical protein
MIMPQTQVHFARSSQFVGTEGFRGKDKEL